MRQGTRVLMPRQNTFRSVDWGGSQMQLVKAKSEGSGLKAAAGSQIELIKMKQCSVDQSGDMSPQQAQSPSPEMLISDGVSISPDMPEPFLSPDSPAKTVGESPVEFIKQSMHDKRLWGQFIIDEHGEIMEDESEDAASYQDQPDKTGKDGDGPSGVGKGQEKKKSKKNDIYLEAIESQSRNATNMIKRDKLNLTVGKVLNKDSQLKKKSVHGQSASILDSQQFFKEKDEDDFKSQKASKKEIKDQGHVQKLSDVDESMESCEGNLYVIRQLTDREALWRENEQNKSVREGDLRSQNQSQADQLQSRTETIASGGLAANTDRLTGDQKSSGKDKSEIETEDVEKSQEDPTGEGEDEDQEKESEIEIKDMGPQAREKELEEKNKADAEDQAYQKLRQRGIPRRQLQGDYVEDQMLDHSDSFRTI